MALDSEARWRLVRRAKEQEPQQPEGEVTIRDVESGDLVAIAEIYNFYVLNSVITFDIEEQTLTEWKSKLNYLQGLDMPFKVAVSPSNQLLGFGYFAPWRQKAAFRRTVEDTIYLKPSAIGKRIGTRLLEELLAAGKKSGIREVVAVISDRGAESSIALHQKFGFEEQGRLAKVGFKMNKWLGTIILQKHL
jgi:phosphinothricin acetyltransferase